MAKNLPLVSVIIPTFNRKDKLLKTIESLNSMEYPKEKIEIIIVDDCSDDGTDLIIKKLVKKNKNMKSYRNNRNSGPAKSRNEGIKRSNGEYVFFTDDDCIVPKNWIIEFITFFEKNKEIVGVGGILEPMYENYISKFEKLKDRILGLDQTKKIIGYDNVPVGFTSNLAYKRKVFSKIGIFDESFKAPAGEDLDLKNRIVKKYPVGFMPVKIIHNHKYDLDYILNIFVKQGLNRNPPKKTSGKILLLLFKFPSFMLIILNKIKKYRKNARSL